MSTSAGLTVWPGTRSKIMSDQVAVEASFSGAALSWYVVGGTSESELNTQDLLERYLCQAAFELNATD